MESCYIIFVFTLVVDCRILPDYIEGESTWLHLGLLAKTLFLKLNQSCGRAEANRKPKGGFYEASSVRASLASSLKERTRVTMTLNHWGNESLLDESVLGYHNHFPSPSGRSDCQSFSRLSQFYRRWSRD